MEVTYAEKLLQGYGIAAPEEIDLEAIAFDHGARVKYRPLNTCEARIVGHGEKAVITINQNSLPERQRFSLGHELGHWIQDKGMVFMACGRSDIGPHRAGAGGAENLANLFASQILMPDYLFRPLSARRPVTFETAREVGARFRSSLTATAIKLVKTGHCPAMVTCYVNGALEWFIPGPDVPRVLKPWAELDPDSRAYDLWKGHRSHGKPALQSAETWIECEGSEDYEVIEDSILVAQGVTVTLLWWKDEAQIHAAQFMRSGR